jgi:hypothetical protein
LEDFETMIVYIFLTCLSALVLCMSTSDAAVDDGGGLQEGCQQPS